MGNTAYRGSSWTRWDSLCENRTAQVIAFPAFVTVLLCSIGGLVVWLTRLIWATTHNVPAIRTSALCLWIVILALSAVAVMRRRQKVNSSPPPKTFISEPIPSARWMR